MGYQPKRKVYRLTFEDEDMHGLVVRARSTSVGNLLGFIDLLPLLDDLDNLSLSDLAKVADLFRVFSEALIEWNVEDEQGQPVPATLEGVRSQDGDFIAEVIKAWFEAVSGVPAPLGPTSNDGRPSPAPPIPMEPLSRSQAS